MIVSFADKDTERLSRGIRVPRFAGFERIALRKLRQLQIAGSLNDLRVPPGNRLEALVDNRAGQHSIRRMRGQSERNRPLSLQEQYRMLNGQRQRRLNHQRQCRQNRQKQRRPKVQRQRRQNRQRQHRQNRQRRHRQRRQM